VIAPGLVRFLEIVKKDLEADDVRVEIGGKDPDDPRLVFCELGGFGRLVVVYRTPPPVPQKLTHRLELLAGTFSGAVTVGTPGGSLTAELATRRLDDALAELAQRVEAKGAVVIDAHSPMIWGNSAGELGGRDVLDALETAERAAPSDGVPSPDLLVARAIATVRDADDADPDHPPVRLAGQKPDFGYLSRSFAATYRLVLAYGGPFSELVAEGTALHALPYIERLVMALPPVDPPPKRARVVKLNR
jgi:hypothetical protein